MQPPCMAVETITAGKATAGRGSMAQRMNVCVPPPLAPVTPIRSGSTSGKLAEPVQRADRVVGLQAHDVLQPGLGLRAEEAPVLRRVHLRPRRPGPCAELHAVGVADHVVVEDDAAHAGQLHAAGLQRIAPAHARTARPPRQGPSASLSSLLNNTDENTLDDIFGITSSTASTDDFAKTDVIVVANCNIEEENFVMEIKIKQAVENGAELVVIGSAKNRLADKADLFVKVKPGTLPAIFNSVSKAALDSNKYNADFVANNTENFHAFKLMTEEYSADKTMKASGADADSLTALNEMLSNAKNAVVVYNTDNLKDKSENDLKSIADYMLLTGRISNEGNGILILRDYANSAGAVGMGMTPGYLPGYIKTPGMDIKSALQQGKIKAAVIVGEDPFKDKETAKYFNKINFIVAADIYPTETTKKADIVFPMTTALESEGTYTSCDCRIQKASQVIKSTLLENNLTLFSQLAEKTGKASIGNSFDKVSAEIKASVNFYNYNDGSFVRSLFKEKFKTPSGRANFAIFKTIPELEDRKKHVIIASQNYYNNSIKAKLVN